MLLAAYLMLAGASIIYILHLFIGDERLSLGGKALSVLAFISLTAGLVRRGLEAGHWPLTSTYEFCLVFVWSAVGVYLLMESTERTKGAETGGAFVLPIAFLLQSYARYGFPAGLKDSQPLLPALRTLWLHLHVLTAAVSYGAFAVACGAGIMCLFGEWGMGANPSLKALGESLSFRAASFGYIWLTLGIITGAMWAQVAWGRYWGWDVKETWALVTWLIYTLFLHARVLGGWRGRPLALLSIVGFASVLFTFLGLSWLARSVGLESLHVY